ncbi:MAG TPA: HAD-IA family hydrolase, partial [Clostridia bacterium]|nr:HAD-IA family hydrolase [Clostridia bacterium]
CSMKINVLIFDCDGVIIDSGADITNAVLHTMRHFNVREISKEEIISYVGRGAETLIRKSFKGCDEQLIQTVIPYYKIYYLENCIIETRLYENVRKTLEHFSDKKIAMVTNKPEAITHRILQRLEVNHYFDIIIGPESVERSKPDPEGLRKVLKEFGEMAENAIMIGDSEYDIQAGKSTEIHTCGVTYGIGNLNDLKASGPELLIDNMIELINLVE